MKNNKFTDTSAGLYVDNYPILSLSDRETFKNHADNLEDILKDCVRFRYASITEKKDILNKLKIVSELTEDIKIIIAIEYPNLYIKHISVGSSYLFRDEVNDLDLNIIVSGSHFSYTETFEVDTINKKLPVRVNKISFIIFGEDDFLFKTNTCDTIEAEDYIHTSLCMREGLVFPMRNVLVYGSLWKPKDLDKKNLLVRIRRQLFHAQLMIEKKVDLHKDAYARLSKSVSRIVEAFLYISVVFPQLKISPKDVIEKEKMLFKSLHRTHIISWLQEANDYTLSLSDLVIPQSE